MKNPISIKPQNRGLLHKNLKVPQGQPIPLSKLTKAKNSPDPAVRKRATFAVNARSFGK
jgi:oligoendopeptidase F